MPPALPEERAGHLERAIADRSRCGGRQQDEQPDHPARAPLLRTALPILLARPAALVELLDELALELGIVGSILPARTAPARGHAHAAKGSSCALVRPMLT